MCECVCSIVDQTIHIILVADLVEREKVGEEGFSYFDHILLVVSSTPLALAEAAHWACQMR